ncbi:MAG: arsenate reductase ArsC [Candidatus Bathyarchaeota archaeon]
MKEILFICTHNSARSQIAEALTNAYLSNTYKAYSAGTTTTKVNPYVAKALNEIGIDTSKLRSKSINEFKGKKFDMVITVCDGAKEACPFFPGKKVMHKSFTDPSKFTGTEEQIMQQVRQARDEIKEWVTKTFQ